MAARSKGEPQGRRREIAGICLLGVGIFCALSLISMQTGSNRMMGPGGAATASGLYSLAGIGAYVVVMLTMIIAMRCFRGRSLVQGASEVLGALGVLSAMTVLLHLPFADGPVTLRGPGGLLGQWLGQVVASFIGGVGAGLAAATLFAVSVMLLTNLRASQVLPVLAFAGRHVVGAAAAAGRGVGRMVVAMFPEKSDAEREQDEDDDSVDEDERTLATPLAELTDDDEDAVQVGKPRSLVAAELDDEDQDVVAPKVLARASDPLEEAGRRAVAALVAEVAAVECAVATSAPPVLAGAAAATVAAVVSEPTIQGAPLVVPPVTVKASVEKEKALPAIVEPVQPVVAKSEPGPIIVEPAFKARQRKLEEAPVVVEPAAAKADGPGFVQLTEGAFQLPATQMLVYKPPKGGETDRQGLYEMAERLEQAMANYGVRGKVKEIHMGPVVTMFEFAPAPGTRTGKIAQLENDLAMALEAQAVRIVAPIPGKAVVGVEVPNKVRETVYLKEILEDESFARSGARLQVSLGKDIKGAPVSVNLAKMPHLLVAGTTGSGKSVAVNGMITSILFNSSPEDVRFIMVDPKMLELSIYEGIPHLLLPVVTDPKKANLALRWAVDEMERRYELLAKTGVRDIASYNAKVEADKNKVKAVVEEDEPKKKLKVMVTGADGTEREVEVDADQATDNLAAAAENGDPVPEADLAEEISQKNAVEQWLKDKAAEQQPMRKLPYIVIVIDEFADLMMVAPKDVETSVARLAQKARAAGLHLILATQRPSVDVITGLIKANFPSRIALQVASKIDSRTILDQPGAETLLGNGDMLFSDRGTKLRRIHGAFLSDDEVHSVVDFLKTQAKPVYDMDILKPRDEDAEEGGAAPADDFHDDLYDQAVAIVCDTRQASVSFIQRRLQIGYNRAARMVEQMEREGIVGPANGIKPREVIAQSGDYLSNPGA